MGTRRDIRELALQALYQMDARGDADLPAVDESVQQAPASQSVRDEAIRLAHDAWNRHAEADRISTELAPAWPTNRQPPVDRSIIRLAWAEMAGGIVPAPIAINEAIELAKLYGSDRSPAFVNGVLDKMARRLRDGHSAPDSASLAAAPAQPDVTAEIPDLPGYTPPDLSGD
jgi:N utilization substance protein B